MSHLLGIMVHTASGTPDAILTAQAGNSLGDSSSNIAVIIGAVAGSVGGATLLIAALWFWRTRLRTRELAVARTAAMPFGTSRAPHRPVPALFATCRRPRRGSAGPIRALLKGPLTSYSAAALAGRDASASKCAWVRLLRPALDVLGLGRAARPARVLPDATALKRRGRAACG